MGPSATKETAVMFSHPAGVDLHIGCCSARIHITAINGSQ